MRAGLLNQGYVTVICGKTPRAALSKLSGDMMRRASSIEHIHFVRLGDAMQAIRIGQPSRLVAQVCQRRTTDGIKGPAAGYAAITLQAMRLAMAVNMACLAGWAMSLRLRGLLDQADGRLSKLDAPQGWSIWPSAEQLRLHYHPLPDWRSHGKRYLGRKIQNISRNIFTWRYQSKNKGPFVHASCVSAAWIFNTGRGRIRSKSDRRSREW